MTIRIRLYPDAVVENADWPKRTVDFAWGEDWTVEDTRRWIAEQGMTVEHFKTLPAYYWNKAHPALADL